MSEGLWTIVVVLVTYVIMVAAYIGRRSRGIHMTVMTGVMVFDMLLPVYLVVRREWYTRFIEHEDILTFGVWMHFMLVLVLYVLYGFQINAALKIVRDREDAAASRRDHNTQGKAILWVRAFVILTGAMLYDERYLLQ